jgi:hypothetical protein
LNQLIDVKSFTPPVAPTRFPCILRRFAGVSPAISLPVPSGSG